MHYPATSNILNDFPYPSKNDVQVFIGSVGSTSTSTLNNWKIWNRPKYATMINMIAIGGGAGGGAGFTTGGGGGGGCSGISRLLIPAHFLPDVLYIQVGDGGRGGAGGASNPGIDGNNSYISLSANVSASNVVLQSGTTPAGGGGGGTGGGAGGTAATAATISTIGCYGIFSSIAGQAGSAGGFNLGSDTPGNPVTGWQSLPLTGGTGGGKSTVGSGAPGGDILAYASTHFTFLNWPSIILKGGAGQTKGNSGLNFWCPFLKTGGTGGGDGGVGSGMVGGNGAIGCGGGGGTQQGSNAGGNGGPGVVMIFSW